MSEMEGHGSSHHSHGAPKGNDMSMYILPLSILLAAVIVGYAMVSAAGALSTSLSGLSVTGSLGAGDAVIPSGDNAPTLQPDTGKTIAELSGDVAGKLGSASASVIVVEYSDFQCPFCRRHYNDVHPSFQQWVDEGTIQLWFKDFPLTGLHPMAAASGNAGRCAAEQGKFWEMHDKMFDEQNKITPTATATYSAEDLKKWGADLGLDTAKFNDCIDSGKYDNVVSSNLAEGQSIGINGTPSFAIGTANGGIAGLIVGACPKESFETAIQAEAAGKKWGQVFQTCVINVE